MTDEFHSTSEQLPKARRVRWPVYLAVFVVVPMVCFAAVLAISTTHWFLYHDDYPGMQQSGYGLRLHHADCDILIDGDSSALTGLRPDVIGPITGLKACNIAEIQPVQGVIGSDFVLDEYLKNNKRPKYLLLMDTPSTFRPYVAPFTAFQPEGVLYALQFERGPAMYRELLHRPEWVIEYTVWAGHALIADTVKRLLPGGRGAQHEDYRSQRERQQGAWPYPLPPETECVRTAMHYAPSSFSRHDASVRRMREHYGVDGTQVIIDVAPVAACDTLKDLYERLTDGLHDNSFTMLPINFYNDGDTHFTPDGGRIMSKAVGEQVLALEKGQSRPAMTEQAEANAK